jgi:hypothetical protein
MAKSMFDSGDDKEVKRIEKEIREAERESDRILLKIVKDIEKKAKK